MAQSKVKGEDQNALAEQPKSTPKPPPENAQSVRLRGLVILSFWAVVVFLGLPVWWWTTSIYRANLPLKEMLEWADGKACKPTFPLQIAIDAPSLQEGDAAHFIRLIQHALDDSNDFPAHHLRLRLTQNLKTYQPSSPSVNTSKKESFGLAYEYETEKHLDDALYVRLIQDDKAAQAIATLQSQSGILEILYSPNQVPSSSSSSSTLAAFVAAQLRDIFEEEQTIIAHILTNDQISSGSSAQPSQTSQSQSPTSRLRSSHFLRPEMADRLANRLTRSLRYSPTYHITISLFSPSSTPSSWQIQEAVTEYLMPVLGPMSRISNFSVDSQIQLHAAFSPTVQAPVQDEESGSWTLREEDLSNFINAAEWPLGPSIAAGPTLNFIIYVPDPSNTPLVVKESQATSWLVPQWGGVVILNQQHKPNQTISIDELSKESIRPALLTFAYQLLSCLGAPQSPQSLQLQLRSLTRIQAASLLLSASSTLGSLARLTKALPTIAIPETVSAAVDITLRELQHTCDSLKESNFNEALHHARIAESQAEKGFFEKSMVGQVYFPDEHKVAVYLPLLGPIGVPLIMSAVKELKRISNAWKSRARAT